MNSVIPTALAIAAIACTTASGSVLNDGEFDQGELSWGKFGSADFNDFFGGDNHASFFADGTGNFGGVFQLGLGTTAGTLFEFSLDNVRIVSNFNADFRFGLEFYAADDATKLGETFSIIDTSDVSDGLVTGDSLVFSMQAAAVDGTAFVRPIILFDNAAPVSSSQANAFVFSASLVVVPSPSTLSLGLAGLAAFGRRRR